MGFTEPGTFTGPPRLERETQIRESPVQVPTGTTTGPRECLGKTIGCGVELSIDDPVIPNFQRKPGKGVIQLKEEQGDEWTVNWR